MQYFIKTFGCQMNKSDSERIAAILKNMGHRPSSWQEASWVIINMCSVRQEAVKKVYNLIPNFKGKKIIITGCVLKNDKKKLLKMADCVLPIKDLNNWPKILEGKIKNKPCSSLRYLKIKPCYQTFPKAFVPIAFGCNQYCAYCVVPYTRGREVRRNKKEILEEIKWLIRKKYNHITLLGENVNAYPKFVELLQKITAIRGDFTVNFMAANPNHFSERLIGEIAKNPKLEKYLHLPLQSGDDAILKKMRRPYTSQQYLELIYKIKKQIPNVKIVTDIIVGFPGETKKAFENTVNVFNKVGFYQAYIAKYSPRPGTAAFTLADDVSLAEKKRRFDVLNQLLKKIAEEKNKKLIGKTETVLVEKCQDGFCFGKTGGNKNVKFEYPAVNGNGTSPLTRGDKRGVIGKFIKIKIEKATAWGLLGEI